MSRPEGPRRLRLQVLRQHPEREQGRPHLQRYELDEADNMTLYLALVEIQEEQDPSLQFDFVCRAGICGACGMLINGRPGLACRTLTRDLPAEITLAPLPGFAIIADLCVDSGRWMRGLSERLETWIHAADDTDLDRLEAPMEPQRASEIYELERCIECGCCIAACGTAQMRHDFIGAAGLNKIARFRLDPRDRRDDGDYYELVGNDAGIFGCLSLLGCNDFCPKQLPLQVQLAYLRRKMLRIGIRGRGATDPKTTTVKVDK